MPKVNEKTNCSEKKQKEFNESYFNSTITNLLTVLKLRPYILILCVVYLASAGNSVYGDQEPVWSMDKIIDNKIIPDQSGNNNNAKYVNMPVYDKSSRTLAFNGKDSYVDCGNKPQFNITNALTIQVWVKFRELTNMQPIICKDYNGRVYPYMLWEERGFFTFSSYVYGDEKRTFYCHSTTEIIPGNWYLVTGTFDKAAGTASLYVNGKIESICEFTHSLPENDCPVLIGKYQGNKYFNGLIAEAKIYNRALSPEEIVKENVFPPDTNQAETFKGAFKKLELERRLQFAGNKPWIRELKIRSTALWSKIKYLGKTKNLTLEGVAQEKEIKDLLSGTDKILTALEQNKIKNRGLLVYVTDPIGKIKIFPDTVDVPGKISDEISINACRGEYEPASFVLCSDEDISSLKIKPTALSGKNAVIPASSLDIKVVKCWYQTGKVTPIRCGKFLTPELLLNDDTLVKTAEGKNYLKLSFPSEEKYVCISEKHSNGIGNVKSPSALDFPVRDAGGLQPVNLIAGKNKQFWITIKVPLKTPAGIYCGRIILEDGNARLGEISINVNVHPFELLPPYYVSSIFYCGELNPGDKAYISSRLKSTCQMNAELRNLLAHGISNPTVYQKYRDKDLVEKVLAMRNRLGNKGYPLYYLGLKWGIPEIKNVKAMIKLAKSYDIPECYFYGFDEARGTVLKSQRESWKNIHSAGGKVFVAGARCFHVFNVVGDLLDIFICVYRPVKAEAEKWHSKNHKIWCYSNPQGGVENPAVYRHNYGILLWQNDYDGACTYAYQAEKGNVWNDFDGNIYRDHNFTYPTVDSVIDTVQWEGYREGVDDIRYLTTLLRAFEKAKQTNKADKRDIILKTEKYLETLKKTDILQINLNNMRLQMAEYISAMQK